MKSQTKKSQGGFLVTDANVQLFMDGKTKTVPRRSAQARTALEYIRKNNLRAAWRAMDVVLVQDRRSGEIILSNGRALIRTPKAKSYEALPECLSRRLIDLVGSGAPITPLLKFAARLWANPSLNSREQLYLFLEHQNLPITPDGKLLAYKAVQADWTDKHTGKYSNKPGNILRMPRRQVDDNPGNPCSRGFHVGSLEYVLSFAGGTGDRIVLVEVDPADVVSVPDDSAHRKVRTSEYLVLSEYAGALGNGVRRADAPYDTAGDDELPIDLDEVEVIEPSASRRR